MRLISPVKVLRRVGQWEGLLGRGALWQVCRMVGDQLSIVVNSPYLCTILKCIP